jgi:hypothetical protein
MYLPVIQTILKLSITLHLPTGFEKAFGDGDAVKWNDSIGLVQEGNVITVLICLRIDGNTPNFDKKQFQ